MMAPPHTFKTRARVCGPWTCPERADTSDVGVSPRGGSPNGEEGGGERGTPAATPVVHAEVQGRGHRLGAAGGAGLARDLPPSSPEGDRGAAVGRPGVPGCG